MEADNDCEEFKLHQWKDWVDTNETVQQRYMLNQFQILDSGAPVMTLQFTIKIVNL